MNGVYGMRGPPRHMRHGWAVEHFEVGVAKHMLQSAVAQARTNLIDGIAAASERVEPKPAWLGQAQPEGHDD